MCNCLGKACGGQLKFGGLGYYSLLQVQYVLVFQSLDEDHMRRLKLGDGFVLKGIGFIEGYHESPPALATKAASPWSA